MHWNIRSISIFTLINLSCFIFSCFTPLSSYAWNCLGHQVIASIAYQNVKPTVRKNLDSIVAHFTDEYPKMKTFMDLSCWPDSIRAQRINTYTHWHYIDTPFSQDQSPLVNTIKDENAVWAIENVRTVVKNSNANVYERVRFLAFLIHIVADIHQPLHASTCIANNHPNGDKGGNLFYVLVKNRRMNLHELWDGGLGVFEGAATEQNATQIAKHIISLHSKAEFGSQIFDLQPKSWAKEGLNNAKKYVYTVKEEQSVDNVYIDSGKQHVEAQAALAGYRLAEMLTELLR